MTKKKVAAFFTAAALCGALAVGSSMAYLTDHDSVTNKFSVGKVDIVGHEPNYTPDNDGKTNNIVPTQVIKKDPQIENVGKNDAYVYLDVSIPIAKVITVNAAGNRLNGGVAKDTELFSMNNVSKKWTLMYNKRVGDNMVYTYTIPQKAASAWKKYELQNQGQAGQITTPQSDESGNNGVTTVDGNGNAASDENKTNTPDDVQVEPEQDGNNTLS